MKADIFWVADYYKDIEPREQFIYDLIDQVKMAEKYGFQCAWFAEHHFSDYGTIPAPQVFLSAVSQKTSKIRLGPAVVTIVFRNPINVAEEYSLLDILSNGRVELAVGSGYLKHEFEGFGVSMDKKREIFDEALEILLLAFKGEKFSYSGKYFNFNNVNINVKPIQKPHPPIWIAALRAEAAYHIAKKGHSLIMIPYATVDRLSDLREIIDAFREGNESKGKLALAFHAHVANTYHEAVSESKEYLERYVFSRLYAKRRTLEQLYESGLYIVGGPEEVASQIEFIYNIAKPDRLIFLLNFGMMPDNLLEKSMDLLSSKVRKILESKGIELEFN